MDIIKPWYLSRTIWASMITIVAAAAGAVGIPVDDLDHAALADALLQGVTAIAGLAAIIGRFGATTRIR